MIKFIRDRNLLLYACSISLILFSCFTLSAHSQASSNFTYAGSQYLIFSEKRLNWENAENECFMNGGHLASVLSFQETQALLNEAAELSLSSDLWIGLNSRAIEGQFRWSDHSNVNYTNWASTEPDNLQEHLCVVMDSQTGEWSNIDCSLNGAFVCKLAQEGACPWDNEGIAPYPLIEHSFEGGDILVRVRVAQRVNATVRNQVLFESEYEPVSECVDSANIFNLALWDQTLDDCVTIFSLRMPVDDFISMTNASLSRHNQTMLRVTNDLYVTYMDRGGSANNCTLSTYRSTIDFKTLIAGDVDFDFNSTLAFTPQLTTFSLNAQGKLVVDLVITPSDPQFWFSNFRFGAHSNALLFQVEAQEEDCADAGLHLSCSYHITFVSNEAYDSYSGVVLIWFDFNFLDEYTTNTTLFFHLRYKGVDDAAAVDNIVSTSTMLTDASFSNEVELLTPFERMHILTETDSQIQIPNSKLVYDDVFLCCTKSNIPLAPYNPSSDNYGCTVRDDNIMSFWAQLVTDGESNPDFFTEIEDFGALTRNKLGLSFNPFGLYGDDKLCYVHTKARIQAEASGNVGKRFIFPREASNHRSTYQLESSATFMVQSCGAFASKDSCLEYRDYCEWRYGVQVCVRKEAHSQENSASSAILGTSALFVCIGSLLIAHIL